MFTLSRVLQETRWAIRRVRGRRWRAGFSVVSLALTFGACIVVFSIAEVVTLARVPFANASRLVALQSQSLNSGPDDFVAPSAVALWQNQKDLFAAFHAFDVAPSLLIVVRGEPRSVGVSTITPGLFEMLGVVPSFGRPLTALDLDSPVEQSVLLSETLAREMFGSPQQAVGKVIQTYSATLRVIGVMPHRVHFPSGREQIWKAMDLENRGISNVRTIGRLTQSIDSAEASRAVQERAPSIYGSLQDRSQTESPYGADRLAVQARTTVAVSVREALRIADRRTISLLFLLLSATALLFLVACANVASFEVGEALIREQNWSVQRALGGGTTRLILGACCEASVLASAGMFSAVLIGGLTLQVIAASWPMAFGEPLADPSSLGYELVPVLATGALIAWLSCVVPLAAGINRTRGISYSASGTRSVSASRGAAGLRGALSVGAIAITLVLMLVALTLGSTYRAAISVNKGFDADRVLAIELNPGPIVASARADLDTRVTQLLRTHSAVERFSRASDAPPRTAAGYNAPLRIGGEVVGRVRLSTLHVDPEFFSTLNIPFVRGPGLSAASPRQAIVIDESFAARFWPGRDPVGERFRVGPEFEVVGVAARVLYNQEQTADGRDQFVGYQLLPADAFPLKFMVRLRSPGGASSVASAIQALASSALIRTGFIEDEYTRLQARSQLASHIGAAVAILACIVALIGMHAVTAFVVEMRTKEIAVRMALGATQARVQRLILLASATKGLLGVALGLVLSLLIDRALRSEILGLVQHDVWTYLAAAGAVVVGGCAAAALPVRRAARVALVQTLRHD